MSRLRCIFRPPPFKAYQHLRAAQRHACPAHLELPLQSRIRWSYFWYAGILALGITTGLGARQFAAPLGLPTPGTPEDRLIIESLGQDIDKLDIVQLLRKQSFNLHSDTPITGTDGRDKFKVKGWVELDFDFAKGEEAQGRTGILGALSGTRGLGVQRAFWNAETKEMVAVVWIGGGLAGWPGVGHGGAIATVFEEIMARMVRGPSGAVGMYTIHSPSHADERVENDPSKVTLMSSLYRASPPPNLVKHNICKTNIQPRLLHPARVLLTTESTSNRAPSRTRSATYKELAGLAIRSERFDQAARVEASS